MKIFNQSLVIIFFLFAVSSLQAAYIYNDSDSSDKVQVWFDQGGFNKYGYLNNIYVEPGDRACYRNGDESIYLKAYAGSQGNQQCDFQNVSVGGYIEVKVGFMNGVICSRH